MARIAVIGHVEWVLQARSREPVASGEIVQLHDAFEEPGGGGGVAARALPVARRRDDVLHGARRRPTRRTESERILRSEGCEVRAGRSAHPQNRVTTISDPAGERTIFIHGPNDSPRSRIRCGWDELAAFDGVFYTGDDPRTVVAARAAPVLVVTARRLASVIASGVQVDVLAGSANDRGEHYEARRPARAPAPRASGPTARAAAAISPTTAARAAGRRSRRRARSSTPTAPATSSWPRSRSSSARGAGRDDALAAAARAAAAQLTRRGGGPT